MELSLKLRSRDGAGHGPGDRDAGLRFEWVAALGVYFHVHLHTEMYVMS
jgi:hypothetical protein